MGGSCNMGFCGASRGATCTKLRTGFSRCVCGEDECAQDGACVQKSEYTPPSNLIGFGNFSKSPRRRGEFTMGAESIAATRHGGAGFGSMAALTWTVAIVGMVIAVACATVAFG